MGEGREDSDEISIPSTDLTRERARVDTNVLSFNRRLNAGIVGNAVTGHLNVRTAGTKAQAGDGRMTTQAAREGGPDGIVLSEEREVREKDGSTAGAAQRHRAPLRRLLSHLNHQENPPATAAETPTTDAAPAASSSGAADPVVTEEPQQER